MPQARQAAPTPGDGMPHDSTPEYEEHHSA